MAKFNLGTLQMTPGALEALQRSNQSPMEFLRRHVRGDWGTVDGEDWRLNDEALKIGARVLSAYVTANNEPLWVITEADRSYTTILTPDEY